MQAVHYFLPVSDASSPRFAKNKYKYTQQGVRARIIRCSKPLAAAASRNSLRRCMHALAAHNPSRASSPTFAVRPRAASFCRTRAAALPGACLAWPLPGSC